ncbi:MAG: endonuclease/exonuclease/phosphatase family protein [Dysgonomonas sp.]|nr:endonuclease/exonuclease/phosphatase family protein [Dysgonomonas sp.]
MKHLLFLLFILFSFSISAQESNAVRVMSYNIRNAKGLDDKTDYKRIADVIEAAKADVVAVQEIDSVTQRSKQTDVLKEIATLTHMHHTYAPAIDYDGGKYGIGILSKDEPLSSIRVSLPGREEKRALLICEFEEYVIFATHFSLNQEDRLSSIEIINREASRYNKPVFLAGDLNAEPKSQEIKTLKQNWKILNRTNDATFPANNPKRVIDYIAGYTTNNQPYQVLKAKVVDEKTASDHRPLFVDIRFFKPLAISL